MSKDKVRITSKVTTFTDVSKSLQDIEKILNSLIDTNTSEAEKELLETEGSTGDIQVTQNTDKSYSFEVKTEDGWKTPVIGDSAIKFKDKPASISKQQVKSIDEIEVDDASTGDSQANLTTFDEKANKFILARPDYDSGWVDIDSNPSGGGTLTHNLGVYPRLATAWFAPDADYNSGDPTQLFLLNLDVGMRHQDSWTGVSTLWTKTTMQYWLHTKIYTTYGVYNDPMANGWDKFEDGYMRVFLWK